MHWDARRADARLCALVAAAAVAGAGAARGSCGGWRRRRSAAASADDDDARGRQQAARAAGGGGGAGARAARARQPAAPRAARHARPGARYAYPHCTGCITCARTPLHSRAQHLRSLSQAAHLPPPLFLFLFLFLSLPFLICIEHSRSHTVCYESHCSLDEHSTVYKTSTTRAELPASSLRLMAHIFHFDNAAASYSFIASAAAFVPRF